MTVHDLFAVHRGFFSAREQEVFSFYTAWNVWKPCPKWLGSFSQQIFGQVRGKDHGPLPKDLKQLADRMSLLLPQQRFTTAFIQKYIRGEETKWHLDPKSNTDYTVIAVFGRWRGGETLIGKLRIILQPGDVLVQRCHTKGKKRPLHRLSKITEGERYALIINTIK